VPVVVQITGVEPSSTRYVDAASDPRHESWETVECNNVALANRGCSRLFRRLLSPAARLRLSAESRLRVGLTRLPDPHQAV
jgi:hypothetical protein